MEMPIKNEDKDNITVDTCVFKPMAISGKAGKYMSMDKGLMAVNKPNTNKRRNLFLDLLFDMRLNKTLQDINAA
jgi:hypothetical protein